MFVLTRRFWGALVVQVGIGVAVVTIPALRHPNVMLYVTIALLVLTLVIQVRTHKPTNQSTGDSR